MSDESRGGRVMSAVMTAERKAHYSSLITRHSSLAVRCRGVTKQFGAGEAAVMALRGVDADVRLGELTLLVGPSGCGKTTLISVIAGLLDPTDGTVEVLGEPVTALRGRRLVEFRGKNIGFVF